MIILSDTIDSEYAIDIKRDGEIVNINITGSNTFRVDWSESGLNNKHTLVDHGNGVTIKINGKKPINLGYDHMEYVYLLFKVWKDSCENGPKQIYKYLEVNELEDLK